jgi:hypothetical protein
VDTLALKLLVTPLLIGAATLVGRRWGQAVGGWLVGLPLTSGPVAFFIALDHGSAFGAGAAVGSLRGLAAEASFCVGYSWCARRAAWPLCFVGGSVAFAIAGLLMQALSLPTVLLVAVVIGALLLALRLLPQFAGAPVAVTPPRWDLPARMIAATTLVLALTSAAQWLGPELSGLISTFPLFGSVLAVFAHRALGTHAALNALRGLLLGLFSFAAFFVALDATIERLGTGTGFILATTAALAVQTASLLLARSSLRRI